METKLKLVVILDPPLPERQFLMVSKQRTVRELRNEIKRRMHAITAEPIVLSLDGLELMDDDDVADVLKRRSRVHVGLLPAPAPAKAERRAPVVISRREHGSADSVPAKRAKPAVAEAAYEGARALDREESDSDGAPEEQPSRAKWADTLTAADLDALAGASFDGVERGDLIAYKQLELGSDMAPALSAYRIGRVIGTADGALDVRVVRRLEPGHEPPAGRRAGQRRAGLRGEQEPPADVRLERQHVATLKVVPRAH